MYVKICPWCKSKFYSANKNNLMQHSNCSYRKSEKRNVQVRPFRTSTPVPQTERVTSSFSDSVIDFFYQTWKNGLVSSTKPVKLSTKKYNNRQRASIQPPQVSEPFFYASNQVFYGNTVMCQTVMPAIYLQPVGYRPDGTFGVLPFYWPCILQ